MDLRKPNAMNGRMLSLVIPHGWKKNVETGRVRRVQLEKRLESGRVGARHNLVSTGSISYFSPTSIITLIYSVGFRVGPAVLSCLIFSMFVQSMFVRAISPPTDDTYIYHIYHTYTHYI